MAAWRVAYRAFGIKRTSYRSSVERLIKRVLAGDPIPEVNALVDLYNAVSVDAALCLGCDDLDATEGDLEFRYSRREDTFFDMGAEAGEDPNDPPKEGEVVYADQRHVLCRRWNWRQDARTKVTTGDQADRAHRAVERGWRRRGGGCGAGRARSARMRRDDFASSSPIARRPSSNSKSAMRPDGAGSGGDFGACPAAEVDADAA